MLQPARHGEIRTEQARRRCPATSRTPRSPTPASPYLTKDGSPASAYPGDAALKLFADGACAQEYTGYVGKDYLDSSYFFTYLLPSARGWEQQKDRTVLCFVTTTGQQLTSSVKNSKR